MEGNTPANAAQNETISKWKELERQLDDTRETAHKHANQSSQLRVDFDKLKSSYYTSVEEFRRKLDV